MTSRPIALMPIDPEFLEMLACPACKTRLVLKNDQRLLCCACHRSYPVRDELPILLIEEASLEEPETREDVSRS